LRRRIADFAVRGVLLLRRVTIREDVADGGGGLGVIDLSRRSCVYV